MSTAADVVRELLTNLGIGAEGPSGPWPVFVGFLPDRPDNAVCIYDTAGKLDGRIMRSGEQVEHPGIQVRVRGLEYVETREKTEEIARALDAQVRTAITVAPSQNHIIHNISRSGGIIPIGMEETDRRRYSFTINAMTTIERD